MPTLQPSTRPLILLSNDDGYRARGLRTLAAALSELGDVVVCAPESEQSTTSHSLTLTRPLRLRQVENGIFAVDGTPADCVYVALNGGTRVLPRMPDVVVSGLNHGLNLATDVFYSGTVAAAREGALRGIPSIATSADGGGEPWSERRASARSSCDSSSSLRRSRRAACASVPAGPPFRRKVPAPLVNVNVPPGDEWGIARHASGAAPLRGSRSNFASTLAGANTSGSAAAASATRSSPARTPRRTIAAW